MRQFTFAKMMVIVDEDVDPHDQQQVLAAIASQVDAGRDAFTHLGPPDPFDPAYRASLDARLRQLASRAGDPWLLGVFIDNELSWTVPPPWKGGRKAIRISAAVLAINGPEFAVKRELVKVLRERYGTVASLNEAWGVDATSWEDLLQPIALTAKIVRKAESDLIALDRQADVFG